MRNRWLSWCVVAALAVPTACQAAGTEASTVDRLMARSGMDKQLEQFPPLAVMELEQAAKRHSDVSAETLSKLRRAVLGAFEPKVLRADVSDYLIDHLSPNDMSAVLKWLDSPLGTKITGLEEAASTPEAYAQMQAAAKELAQNTARVQRIQRLDALVHATQATVQMAIAAQVAFTAALVTATQPGSPPSIPEIVQASEAHRAQLTARLGKLTETSLLYSYRTLSDAELDQYMAFAQHDFAKRYHQTTMDGLLQAVVKASEQMADALVRSRTERGL